MPHTSPFLRARGARPREARAASVRPVDAGPPGARSFLAARLFARLARTLLYLCPGVKEAEEASRELSAYLGPDAVLPFPSVEVAPYEQISPYLARGPRPDAGPPPAPLRPPRRGRRLRGRAAEKTVPPEIFLDAVETVSPGDTARYRRVRRAPRLPRLRPPSRGGGPGRLRGPRAGSSTCTAPRIRCRRGCSWTATSSSRCAGSTRRRSARSRRARGSTARPGAGNGS